MTSGRNWKVVVADDNGIVLEVLRCFVQEIFGPLAEVSCASDGEEAYRLLSDGPVDLLLTDYDMPRMNGGQLAARLASEGRLKTLPVLIVTGGFHADEDPHLAKAGVTHFLRKPFTLNELRGSVLEVMGLPETAPMPDGPAVRL